MIPPLPRPADRPGRFLRSGFRMLARILSPGLLVAVLALPARVAPASGQAEPAEPGRIRVGAAELTLSGRVQTQFNTTRVDGEPAMPWMMRRARLEARVRVNERVGGKIQPDFSGERFTLKDAYVLLTLSPALQRLAGQDRSFKAMFQLSF